MTLVISHIIYLFFRKFLNFHSWKWIFSHRTNNSYFFSKKRHLVWLLTLAVYFRCKYWRSPTRNVRKNLVKGYFIKQLLMPWPRCSNIQQYLCRFCDLIVKFRAQQYLPVVYVSRVDLLPKLKEGRIKVDVRIIINTLGLFSGILIALKSTFNNKKWNNAWIVLLLSSNGWILLDNIFWKSKR